MCSAPIFIPPTRSLTAFDVNSTHHLLKTASAPSAAHERVTGTEDKMRLNPCYHFNDTIASVKGSKMESEGSAGLSPLSVLTFDDLAETTWECVLFPETSTLQKCPPEIEWNTI